MIDRTIPFEFAGGRVGSSIDDGERLKVLSSLGLLDSPPEARFDRLTRLLCRALSAPVALISLVDDKRQFFKSQVGLSTFWAEARQTPLTHSFCQHVVTSERPLRIDDARADPLVRDNAAIADLDVIAYLGAPIRSATGHVLGSLCAIDNTPRAWSDEDEAALLDIASLVEEQIQFAENEKRWRAFLDAIPQMVWSALPDGYVDFYNRRWYEFTGLPVGSSDGESWQDVVHVADRDKTWASWQAALSTGQPYEVEYRLRDGSGVYRWALGRALPLRDHGGAIERWFGTCTDIDDLKQLESQRDVLRRELGHRIQNIFTVVAGLISAAARVDPSAREFAKSLSDRIVALAVANRYVQTDQGAPQPVLQGSLHDLIGTIMAPYRRPIDGTANVIVEGEDRPLSRPEQVTAFALILHELATNSLKYGALSVQDGTVTIATGQEGGQSMLTWTEAGGPRIPGVPSRRGFGWKLIEMMLDQIGARLERRWEPGGLIACMQMDG